MKASIQVPNELFFTTLLQHLGEQGSVKFTCRGESMRPFISNGDPIVLAALGSKSVKLGQIVLARYKKAFVLHRVVGRSKAYFYLAGDANLAQVEKIPLRDVLACVERIELEGKNIKLYTTYQRSIGLLWYYLRPVRVLMHKVSSLIK